MQSTTVKYPVKTVKIGHLILCSQMKYNRIKYEKGKKDKGYKIQFKIFRAAKAIRKLLIKLLSVTRKLGMLSKNFCLLVQN
jgi:hypothetical protein